MDDECNKGKQWHLKLQNVWGKNPREMEEIPIDMFAEEILI
ncbi:hypothetical protein [Prevotellamassilia timonensis]